ncbi:MAG TPA: SMI1/KNR4 family protein [Kiloniellaceae bacterium]|nr:SMI1/KNR4 family protein [Kiloniellaceae bacterium]
MSGGGEDGALGGLMQLMARALGSGRGFDPQALAEQVAADVRSGKTSMGDVFGGAQPGAGIEIYTDAEPADGPLDLLPPASDADIAAAEAAFGFALPDDLKQLYSSVGNGGFGPGAGFRSLAALAAAYRDFRSAPQGPCDETWPAHLLPIVPVDMGEACYDLTTGQIVRWDQEELVDEAEEDTAWDRSFMPWAESLATWLDGWLAQRPLGERLAEQSERSRFEGVRKAIAFCRDMTPEGRAQMGLPDKGWEEQICRNHGVDPKDLV